MGADRAAPDLLLTLVLDAIPQAVWWKDRQSVYLGCNVPFARAAGLSHPSQIVGLTDFDLGLPGEIAAHFRRVDERVMESGVAEYHMLEPLHWPDGRVSWLDTNKVPMRDAEGQVIGILGTYEDLTERNELLSREKAALNAVEAAKELDRLKNDFVSAVSHEIRTPLTTIKGYVEFLEDEIAGPLTTEQRDFVQQLERSTARLEHLVEDLLDLGQLQAGSFKLLLADHDLTATVREVLDSLAHQAQSQGLQLVAAPGPAPLMVKMDTRRISQVLLNLVGNALKFTPRGGTITVSAARRGDGVTCQVVDTGPGIATADRPHLFQRFSQLDAGVLHGGSGLGLNISKAIVEAHGGVIGVESRLGEGSCFWFSLPGRTTQGTILGRPPSL